MTQAERRHDRLAVRPLLTISRLVVGETLNMARLTAELSVSVRALRRDFHERLTYLDLKCRRGQCHLCSIDGGVQDGLDALTFARRSGLANIFPGLNRCLVGMLLTARGMPYPMRQPLQTISPITPLVFYRLVSAATAYQRVLLLAEGERCDGLASYRPVSLDGSWYLAGEPNGHITMHPLATTHAVTVLNTTSTPRERFSQLTTQAGSVQALPHFSCTHEILSSGLSEEEQGNTLI